MKPFLILQIRPLDEASNDEYEAFLKYSGLKPDQAHRIRIEKEGIPSLKLGDYSGIILGGGPSNISDLPEQKNQFQKRFERDLQSLFDEIFEFDFPFLGVCYGMGAITDYLGCKVSKEKYAESVGAIEIELTVAGLNDPLLKDMPKRFMAYCGHKEACQELPPNTELLASSDQCPFQIIKIQSNIYATQFHVELDKKGIELRIDVYRDHGYFKPEDADRLIKEMEATHVEYPGRILQRFVNTYKR
ncbi:MAG: glutamine amidotransferase [Bacteroidia bacterium]|nr:glutamine amidotransferase [Bacteroidia bacterium]